MTGDDAALLETIWREQIPLSVALDVHVVELSDAALVTTAPLAPNINLHGTAFAGSLYSICALTGWGYVWGLGRNHGGPSDIVLARAEIEYRRPVRAEIVCRATADVGERNVFTDAVAAGERARLAVHCDIGTADAPAVRFRGRYLIHAP